MREPILFLLAVALCMGQVCTPQQGSDDTTGTTDLVNGDTTTDGGGTTSDGTQDGTAGGGDTSGGALVVDHLAAAAFDSIPATTIQTVQSNYRIWYGHTSHGGQIMTGLQMIQSLDSSFAVNAGAGSLIIQDDDGVDLGHEGDLGWVTTTRDLLNQPGNTINVIMWSWCDGAIDNTESGINTYLNAMNQLETDYPSVTFVYMTGHLDGQGPTGNLYVRNNQIRAYCQANNKVLYDFADIESYDPTGNYYPDESDACAWCGIWCTTHTCPTCVECAHSHCFNCYQKGRAFWWMMARLAGWNGA